MDHSFLLFKDVLTIVADLNGKRLPFLLFIFIIIFVLLKYRLIWILFLTLTVNWELVQLLFIFYSQQVLELTDNVRYSVILSHHLLMMTSALSCIPWLYYIRHLCVETHQISIMSWQVKIVPILCQKVYIPFLFNAIPIVLLFSALFPLFFCYFPGIWDLISFNLILILLKLRRSRVSWLVLVRVNDVDEKIHLLSVEIKIIDLIFVFLINGTWSLQNYRENCCKNEPNSNRQLFLSFPSIFSLFSTFWRIFCEPLEPSEYSMSHKALKRD